MKYFKFQYPSDAKANVANPANSGDTETGKRQVPSNISGISISTPTESNTDLARYLSYLLLWVPKNEVDLPCPPPFRNAPERGPAWAAWWSALEGRNKAVGG